MGYIIVGDIGKHKECLIYTVMGDREFAENLLTKLQENPSPEEKEELDGYSNIHLKETVPEEEWWNDPFLAN